MTAIQSPLSYIYDGQRCLGFVLKRGRLGFEALSREENSLGVFATAGAAAKAVVDAAKSEREADTIARTQLCP
jgi:hypothetical protein